jgi:hypothetical protein
MTTATVERETEIEMPEEAKARRNAEYLAMLDESFAQSDRGEVISMTFAEWEEWIKNV